MGLLALAVTAASTGALALATPAPLPPAEAGPGAIDVVKADIDRHDRMTVPVRIGQAGPFDFLVDTGAERTVLARDVAQRLRLPTGAAVCRRLSAAGSCRRHVPLPMVGGGLLWPHRPVARGLQHRR